MVYTFLYGVFHVTGLDTPYVMLHFVPHCFLNFLVALLSNGKLVYILLFEPYVFILFGTVVTIMGIYYWPCIRDPSKSYPVNRKWSLVIYSSRNKIKFIGCGVWLYVGAFELFLTPNKVKFIIAEVVPIGSLVLGFTCVQCVGPSGVRLMGLSLYTAYSATRKSGLCCMCLPIGSFDILWVAQMEASGSSFHHEASPSKEPYQQVDSKLRLSVFFCLATNIPMALYMSLFH